MPVRGVQAVWQKLLWLSIAGAGGTLLRYGMSGMVQRMHDGTFPWGTLAVNCLGCFLFGVAEAFAAERSLISSETRTVVLIGFMGAFTTFSTFAFETSQMLGDSQWAFAALNAIGQTILGLAFIFLGLAAGRLV